jgi:tetratricopeptide (TPR) repeat protein
VAERARIGPRMTLRITLLALLLVPTFLGGFSSESCALEGPVDESGQSLMDQLLARADALLAQGDFEQAETLLSEGLAKLSGELDLPQRFTLHYAIALVCVRTANEGGAVSNFVEAIALADQLERGSETGFDGLALSLRLELAGFLLDSGKASDSEALCWDALMRVVEKEDAGGLGRVVVALVSAVLPQTNDESALRSFLSELDAELSRWDGYRLSLPPPPEPIFELLDEGAARLMSENQTEGAARLFEGILRLDRARDADWRIVQDLSSVAFSALLLDDLPAARRALDEALIETKGGPIPVNVWANRCYLAAFEGEWAVAEAHCLGGIAAARSSGDERRAIAMTSVLAGLRAFAGQERKAVNLHEDAAQRYDQLGASQDAAGERARAVMVLTEGRDLDEALRLLQRLDKKREGDPQHPLVEEARQRLALEMLLSSFESADDEEVRSALHSIGDHLFKTGRSVSLTELSLLYLDLVFRSGSVVGENEDLEEAVLAIVGLERELGLEDSGWVGGYAQAVLHIAKGERVEAASLLLSVLSKYEERILSDALGGDELRVWMGRGQSRFYRRPRLEPHRRLIKELMALDRTEEAREIERRVKQVELALLWRHPAAAKMLRPTSPSESHYLSVRVERLSLEEHLMAISLRGGEVAPEQQRAAVAPLLERLREAEAAALKALPADRALLFVPGSDLAGEEPQRTSSGWTDLSSATCRLGSRGGAEIFVDISGLPVEGGKGVEPLLPARSYQVFGPSELATHVWGNLVVLPECVGGEGRDASVSMFLQEEAFFFSGVEAVIRQVRPAPRAARKRFHSSLRDALEAGLAPSEAFALAQSALKKRWRKESVRGAWVLQVRAGPALP